MCLRAQACASPLVSTLTFLPSWTSRFGWEPLDQSGLSIPGPSISVTTGWIPQSSHLQLQVTTRLDVATEATFLEHLTVLKIFLVHIKEWEELGLEGAEDLTWYCHYHLFSEKKKRRVGALGSRNRIRLPSSVAALLSHWTVDQAT